MADIQKLAQSARGKLARGDALNEPDAISKAIRGAGITNRADHQRLMREVGTVFARNKYAEQRRSFRNARR